MRAQPNDAIGGRIVSATSQIFDIYAKNQRSKLLPVRTSRVAVSGSERAVSEFNSKTSNTQGAVSNESEDIPGSDLCSSLLSISSIS
jgi:hypothetical protein